MKNIFTKEVTDEVIERLNAINADTKPQWGKMTAGQMMAHVNVSYEYVYEDFHKPTPVFMKLMLKLFVKNLVVGDKPFKKNSRTAPDFVMTGEKDFGKERERLIGYIKKTQELGADHFDGKESHSFGTLTKKEWNAMFYKHIDHHLTQFGV